MMNKEMYMKGSIRMLTGLLLAFGAVGTLEYDMNASVLLQLAIAAAGLALMYSGIRAMKQQNA
jgi:hypothetical protein